MGIKKSKLSESERQRMLKEIDALWEQHDLILSEFPDGSDRKKQLEQIVVRIRCLQDMLEAGK